MIKYADDTYLVVPASNAASCPSEIDNIEAWAIAKNLKLSRKKSAEIVFDATEQLKLRRLQLLALSDWNISKFLE